jgi:hypothetical protein
MEKGNAREKRELYEMQTVWNELFGMQKMMKDC